MVCQPALEETLSEGRASSAELQRLGLSGSNMDDLAHKLGYPRADDLFIAAARGEMNCGQFQSVARAVTMKSKPSPRCGPDAPRKPVDGNQASSSLAWIKLLTQLARCCKAGAARFHPGLSSPVAKASQSTAPTAPTLPTWRRSTRNG